MKKLITSLIFAFIITLSIPGLAWATDAEVNEAFENGDLVIVPHWERLPGGSSSPLVSWPGEEALDNWYESEEVSDWGVFTYVYDIYYKGEKLNPKVVWVNEVSPTFTGYEPVWNEETQTWDSVAPERDEDGHCLGEYDIQGFSLGDNGSLKAPIKGALSKENYEKIPVWRLVPADLTEPGRVRIVYDGTWNQNKDSVPYTGESYPLTFYSSSDTDTENPMYYIYWTDADGNEILLDRGYTYVGRAQNNTNVTTNPADKTTWAKPVLHGIYDYCGIYIPTEGNFYIKSNVTPQVQVFYQIGTTIIKQVGPLATIIDIEANAPEVTNLAYWHAPNDITTAEPDPSKELVTYIVKAVLNGEDGVDGAQGEPGKNGIDGKDGADGKDGEPGKDGIDGKDGKPGKDGTDGTPGKDGKNGIDGKDGKSAYEIAVLNGFKGTEIEWLASLHGEQGPQGEPGKTSIVDEKTAPSYSGSKVLPKTGDDVLYSIKLLIVVFVLAVATMFLVWYKTKPDKK